MADEALFHDILRTHGAALRRIARSFGAPTGVEDDLHQEILLQLWRALPSFRGQAALATWAYRVALNTALSWRRADGRRGSFPAGMLPTSTHPSPRTPEAILDEFLASLGPIDRSILLPYMDGIANPEIAEITGLSVSAVGVRLHRIRRAYARRYLEERTVDLESLRAHWRALPAHRVPADEAARLVAAVRQRAGVLEQAARRRDLTETVVAIAVAPLFAWLAWRVPSPVSQIGAAVVALGCLTIPIRLRAARGAPTDPTLPVLAALQAERSRLAHQQRLLESVAVWYLGPLFVGCALFVYGGLGTAWHRGAAILLIFVVGVALWWANRRAAATQVVPVIRQLDLTIAELTTLPVPGVHDVP